MQSGEGAKAAPHGTRTRNLLYGTAALIWITLAFTWSRYIASISPTFHLDGAFQVYSSMHRLASGQIPGDDFYPYLGIGPVLMVYPGYALSGGTLGSSVFSAHLVAVLCLSSALSVIAFLVVGRGRGRAVSVVATAFAPLVLIALAQWAGLSGVALPGWTGWDAVIDFLYPGNSLRPVRSAAPYALGLVALLVLRGRAGTGGWFLGGLAIGVIGVLWSNDYGIVSSALCFMVLALGASRSRDSRWPRLGALAGGVLAGAVGIGQLVTRGRLVSYWTYNMRDVRGDQYWYFGPWHEGSRVGGLSDLVAAFSAEHVWFAILVLGVVLARLVRERSRHALVLAYIGAAVLAGGVVGTVGGHIGGYFGAFRVWGFATGLFLGVRAGTSLFNRIVRPATAARHRGAGLRGTSRVVLPSAVVTLIVVVSVCSVRLSAYQSSLASRTDLVYVDALGGYLPEPWAAHLELMRASGTVVEEYSGLIAIEGVAVL